MKNILPLNLTADGFKTFSSDDPGKLNFEVIAKVRGWLRGVGIRKTTYLNYYCGSYQWKHIAENAIGTYVSPGDFIAAMILEGFEYKTLDGQHNCLFKCTSLQKKYLKEFRRKRCYPPRPTLRGIV